jgi:hypothetical protein
VSWCWLTVRFYFDGAPAISTTRQLISIYFHHFDLFRSVRSISILASKSPKHFDSVPAISICFDTRSKSPKLSQSGILHAIQMDACTPAIRDSCTFLVNLQETQVVCH